MVAFPTPNVDQSEPAPAPPEALPVPLIHSSQRLPELDGLRGAAVAAVVLYHAAFADVPVPRMFSPLVTAGKLGWSGVDLFFVLSGFLIGGILLDPLCHGALRRRMARCGHDPDRRPAFLAFLREAPGPPRSSVPVLTCSRVHVAVGPSSGYITQRWRLLDLSPGITGVMARD